MKKIKSLAIFISIITTLVLVTACSDKNAEDKDKSETRVVQSVKGEVKIPSNPKKIVDISGSSEELLLAGYKPIATANVDSYETDKLPSYIREELKDVKIVGHSMMDTMDMEAILEVNPDLIIMSQRQEKIYDQLKEIAPVVMMKDYANDWRSKLTDVSKLFDKEEETKSWLQKYDEKATKLGKEVIEKNGEKTYLPVLASSGQFMVFSDGGIGTLINDDMKLARPKNMPKQDGITLPMISMEGLTDIDADHIVVIATESDKKDLENSAIWAQIRAVKDGNVTILDSAPFFSQSYNPIGKELLLESVKNELTK
ncbi:ABC transporter ferrichrome-specific extracellular solute-binding protein [Clostridioides difficile]|uniref:ABC transporter substrate-binding protein n=1 Tax=Clostridioides difficile TaxID=1496 RepID=UPI000D1E80AC|nr:ABC transporter substrate-binding protein [Clostridioides difficile]EGT2202265.1 ABC transporter substrate-binding protein [Clostridioides difficile]EGT4666046.1 ferrichrome ABC transporter substrate-binding protein [Clostridioides difficile]UUC41572.1 ABC transporter substrate-binding protein [Clostridioides difficile]VFC56291.1 ABC transporter ferrichrome-specific extracellular solute-binding protein [Clostridioides difficile]VHX75215.1 ABC transporter ferrichrome-specific extracellular s